jgi:hypothetical protein
MSVPVHARRPSHKAEWRNSPPTHTAVMADCQAPTRVGMRWMLAGNHGGHLTRMEKHSIAEAIKRLRALKRVLVLHPGRPRPLRRPDCSASGKHGLLWWKPRNGRGLPLG